MATSRSPSGEYRPLRASNSRYNVTLSTATPAACKRLSCLRAAKHCECATAATVEHLTKEPYGRTLSPEKPCAGVAAILSCCQAHTHTSASSSAV